MRKTNATFFMVQGTSSSAGKSVLTAGFLRYFSLNGIDCTPFKPQNMSLNSFVTEDGFEIAVSQAVQSEAAIKKPLRQINPILIKPSSDTEMHLVVEGKHFGNMNFKEYNRKKDFFLKKAMDSFNFLNERNSLIVLEGAGSPAEINLFKYDIANMGFAEVYDIPVILTADIERGGVFASIYGTVRLLKPKWRRLVKGFIINKFRGDMSILQPGIKEIEKRLKIPCLGVMPYIKNLHIEAEDSLELNVKKHSVINKEGANYKTTGTCRRRLNIGIVRLEHIANFNEFDPLFFDERLNVGFFDEVPLKIDEFDIIIIPGSKSTIADLISIKRNGIFDYIKRFEKQKCGIIIGICGGYQMMGERISDACDIEPGNCSMVKDGEAGFGFFKTNTELSNEKILVNKKYKFRINANADEDCLLSGYEIHTGRTFFYDKYLNGAEVEKEFPESCVFSKDRKKIGTYVHGLFANEVFKDFIIESTAKEKGLNYNENKNKAYENIKNDSFNLLSENIEKYINIKLLREIIKI